MRTRLLCARDSRPGFARRRRIIVVFDDDMEESECFVVSLHFFEATSESVERASVKAESWIFIQDAAIS